LSQSVYCSIKFVYRRIKVLINRSADYRNNRVSDAQTARIQRCAQPLAYDLSQQVVRSSLQKRHTSAVNGVYLVGVDVQQGNVIVGIRRQDDSQGKAHVATATHNDYVV